MSTYNQIAYSQAMIQNNVWTAIALSKCNNNPHHTSSEGGEYVCGGVLLLMVIAFIATCIIIRKP
jgi:hypothetical protein